MRIVMLLLLAGAICPGARAADPSAAALIQESALHYASGDWEAARKSAAEAVEKAPNDAQARLQLSMALMKLQRWEQAEAESDRAIALGYSRAAAYNVRASARVKLGRFEGALSDADKAVELNPGGPIGYVHRAAAKAGLKRPAEEILHDYRRASEVDARYAGAYESARRRYAVPDAAALPIAAPAAPRAPVPPAPKAPAAAAPASPAPAAAPIAATPAPAAPAPAAAPSARILPTLVGASAAVVVLLFALWLMQSGWKSHRGLQVRFGSLIAPPSVSVELAPGSVVAGIYIVGRLLEKVGPLEVYEARDLEDAPRVLKRFSPKSELEPAQFSLARKAASLRHPSIETVESVFHEGPRICMACAPMPGETLARARERLPDHRMSPEQALRPLQSLCEALTEAHRQGVTHGAITPRAILLDRGRASLRDFGLAAGAQPEDDLRALAACFAEALTGRSGEDATAGLSGGLAAVFSRALSPSSGFRSADELFQAYRTVVVPLVQ